MTFFRNLSLAMAAFTLFACTKDGAKKSTELKTDDDKFSYVIGQQIGQGLKSQGVNVDVDILAAAIQDALKGTPSKLSQDEMRTVMMNMQTKMMQKQLGEAKENKDKGDKYLAENAKRTGVKSTKSGLQYEVLTEGKGAKPKASDVVKVRYKGTLIDGTEFDSSYKRGDEPAEFPVGAVIKGWTEALQLMPVGSKWKVFIPGELAYGEQGRPSIPPNSTLVFEVELVAINKK